MGKGEKTRKEIIVQALLLARQVGLEGLSLGVLADSLNMSKSGLFAHFKSKEALQLAVLQCAIDEFNKAVILPALTKARGIPRLKGLLDNYLTWIKSGVCKGTCIFMALAQEYDDRPGPVRDFLVQIQRTWFHTIARAATIAVEEGQFAADTDVEQVAFQAIGIAMAFQQSYKLLDDTKAEAHARAAFAALIKDCQSVNRRA